MEIVKIDISEKEWAAFLLHLKAVGEIILHLKQTSARVSMLHTSLSNIGPLKLSIQEAYQEWEMLQLQEIPPLEQQVDMIQQQVDRIVETVQAIIKK